MINKKFATVVAGLATVGFIKVAFFTPPKPVTREMVGAEKNLKEAERQLELHHRQ